ncbi:hypothetical protein ACUXK4_004908 [Methylorubrum extorquens]
MGQRRAFGPAAHRLSDVPSGQGLPERSGRPLSPFQAVGLAFWSVLSARSSGTHWDSQAQLRSLAGPLCLCQRPLIDETPNGSSGSVAAVRARRRQCRLVLQRSVIRHWAHRQQQVPHDELLNSGACHARSRYRSHQHTCSLEPRRYCRTQTAAEAEAHLGPAHTPGAWLGLGAMEKGRIGVDTAKAMAGLSSIAGSTAFAGRTSSDAFGGYSRSFFRTFVQANIAAFLALSRSNQHCRRSEDLASVVEGLLSYQEQPLRSSKVKVR